MYLITEGEGWIRIRGHDYAPQPGQLFIVPAGERVSFATTNPDHTLGKYWCHCTATAGEMNLFRLLQLPVQIDVPDMPEAIRLFERLIEQHQSKEITSTLRVKAALLEIISAYLEGCPPEEVRLASYESTEKLNAVLRHIEDHLAEEMTLEQLARLVHLHPNYFVRFFKTMLGEPPIQYINRMRMEKAKLLLSQTGAPVSEIADAVGLSFFYFSRLFKQYSGFAPTEYRRQLQGRNRDETDRILP
ncbi:helix-turn-helix transcriptional regulator [Paenibacillus sp. y28]|uniref:helix-turn-helix transcriptional regulator n=1 Tax=Paenibacillus sp. y28 TaxID=3129110 RepID=UPI003015A70C